MGIKYSNESFPINFKLKICDVVSMFEVIIATEEYYQRIHWIIKMGVSKLKYVSNSTVYE